MIPAAVTTLLCAELCERAGLGKPERREPIRIWRLSGVERLHLRNQRTAVLKYACAPFTSEAVAMRYAGLRGVPVPPIYATAACDGIAGILMADLGEPARAAALGDGVTAATRIHRAGLLPGLPTIGQPQLQALPQLALTHLDHLAATGRFTSAAPIRAALAALDRVAAKRAEGTERPPFGLCHGELHPTSLHITARDWRVLDLAKAFNGPGLLDLAHWHGTRHPPDPAAMRVMTEQYIAAGGPPAARTPRGGLPAEVWALGWHRVHAAYWFLEQAVHRVNGPDTDHTTQPVIERQLTAAAELLS